MTIMYNDMNRWAISTKHFVFKGTYFGSQQEIIIRIILQGEHIIVLEFCAGSLFYITTTRKLITIYI